MESSPNHPPHVALALAGLGIAALIAAAALVWASGFGDDQAQGTPFALDDGGARPDFTPETNSAPPPATAERRQIRRMTCHPTAQVRRPVTLRRRPGGRARVRLAPRTEWKSPRIFGVVRRKGDWLAVQAAELRNGEVAWLAAEQAEMGCGRWSLHADLSKRTLHVKRDGRTVRRFAVAVGAPTNPTPRGRFSVTDKLRVTNGASPYGCCVLALTGHQVRLPEGWPGGDRLAVHATSDLSSIGRPASLGCLRTDSRRARWLIETIPLGAPVFVRS
jgi:hypothetical protein